MKNIAGGNRQRYEALVKAYERQHRTISDDAFRRGASAARLAQYKNNKAVNEAVSVQTTYAFDDINDHLKTVHELSEKIEKTDNTKSALDLNSRLIAEMAYLQIQTLKLQTLISQQASQLHASDLDMEGSSAEFNRLPDM